MSLFLQPETLMIFGAVVLTFLAWGFSSRLRDERVPLWGSRLVDPAAGPRGKRLLEVEDLLGIKLPQAYKRYMSNPGPDAIHKMAGSDWDLGVVVELQGQARELLLGNGEPFKLRDQDFVCMMHQGYLFHYFPCDEGEDPPVYRYTEGRTPVPEQVCQNLSGWLPDGGRV